MSPAELMEDKVMGVRLPLTLIQAVKLRAIAEDKTYSEWVAAALEEVLYSEKHPAASVVAGESDMAAAIVQLQQRLATLERRTQAGEQLKQTPEAGSGLPEHSYPLPDVDQMSYDELLAALKQRMIDMLARRGRAHYELMKQSGDPAALSKAIAIVLANNGPDPRKAALAQLLNDGVIKVFRHHRGSSYSLCAKPSAPQARIAVDAVSSELIEVFNALSEALGDEDIEICLSQPLQTQVIDIWIPAAKLALMLASKHTALTGKEMSAYHTELEAFAPQARAVPVSIANINTIANSILRPATTTPPAAPAAPAKIAWAKKGGKPPSKRHAEVMALLAKGLTQKQVADKTGYHVKSVEKISQTYSNGGAVRGKSYRDKVKGIITSPGFALRYKGKHFKAKDVAALLKLEPNRTNLSIISNDLRAFVTLGILDYTRKGHHSGTYHLVFSREAPSF